MKKSSHSRSTSWRRISACSPSALSRVCSGPSLVDVSQPVEDRESLEQPVGRDRGHRTRPPVTVTTEVARVLERGNFGGNDLRVGSGRCAPYRSVHQDDGERHAVADPVAEGACNAVE